MNTRILRDTKQRQAIKQAIEEANRPVGPKEILDIASSYVPNLGIATVYRNIKVMVDQGELDTVDLPGQASRYQIPSDQKQNLFICQKTDRVFALDTNGTNGVSLDLPEGFSADHYKLIIYGECSLPSKRRRRKRKMV